MLHTQSSIREFSERIMGQVEDLVLSYCLRLQSVAIAQYLVDQTSNIKKNVMRVQVS